MVVRKATRMDQPLQPKARVSQPREHAAGSAAARQRLVWSLKDARQITIPPRLWSEARACPARPRPRAKLQPRQNEPLHERGSRGALAEAWAPRRIMRLLLPKTYLQTPKIYRCVC